MNETAVASETEVRLYRPPEPAEAEPEFEPDFDAEDARIAELVRRANEVWARRYPPKQPTPGNHRKEQG
jgi:hypothetical protein